MQPATTTSAETTLANGDFINDIDRSPQGCGHCPQDKTAVASGKNPSPGFL
jgi:hypothetical protein